LGGWIKHVGKAALGRPRHRWDVNITFRLREMEWRAWSGIIWLWMRAVLKYLWVPGNIGYFLTSLGNVSFSKTLVHGVT
jgi:hypothetical protein